MPSVQRRPRVLGLSELLLVLGVLVGVLLMHGVTADHDMAMGSAATMADSQVGTDSSHATADDMSPDLDDSMSSSSRVNLSTAPMSSHSMIDMCVAVLVSVLLLPLRVAFRLKRRDNDHEPPLASLSMVPRAVATRWLLTPSLTQLCVLRT